MTTNTTTNPRQNNCPWMMPVLYVGNIQKSLDFYQKAFGFEPDMILNDDDGNLSYADMLYKGEKLLMIIEEGSQMAPEGTSPLTSKTAPPMSLYVYCDNVDDLTSQAKLNQTTVLSEPEDAPWGDRTAVLKDPDEFVWCFATKIKAIETQQISA